MAVNTEKDMKRPDFCVIEVSHRCMFRCKMCNYWKTAEDPDEISIPQLSRFISSLKSFTVKPFEMNISGGEPLLKKVMLDFIRLIAEQGFRFSLVTNGFLINKAMARGIADSGLNFLAISLDSLDENTQDFDDAERVHRGLDRISLAHREALTLFFLEDFSIDEIASILNVSPGTVKSRLHYAKRALRLVLEKEV